MSHISETWPSIPLPFIDYGGAPRNTSISGAAEETVNMRRSRFEKAYAELRVRWIFTVTEYATFRAFLQTNLGNGAASFGLQLRYPLGSALSWWIVKFTTDPTYVYDEGHWTVEGTIDLIQTYTP